MNLRPNLFLFDSFPISFSCPSECGPDLWMCWSEGDRFMTRWSRCLLYRIGWCRARKEIVSECIGRSCGNHSLSSHPGEGSWLGKGWHNITCRVERCFRALYLSWSMSVVAALAYFFCSTYESFFESRHWSAAWPSSTSPINVIQ